MNKSFSLKKNSKLSYMNRKPNFFLELSQESINIKFKYLDDFIERIDYFKSFHAAKNNEEMSNHYWRLSKTFNLYKTFINFFEEMQSSQYRQAWYTLEKCEISCKLIIENSDDIFIHTFNIELISKLISQWQSLYPYSLFISPEYLNKTILCSICGHKLTPRARCGHQIGKLYNGEVCVHIIQDFEIINFSIVYNPVQKYSVIHDDSTLNFTHLDYLINNLDSPFEPWSFQRKTMKYAIDKFKSVQKEDQCPCNSKLPFDQCCIDKEYIDIPHIDYIFHNKSSMPTDLIFPY